MGGSRNNGLRMIFFPDYFHLRINVLQIKRINPPADPALQGVFTRRNRSGPADRLPADESAGRAASRGHLEFRHGSRLQTRRASGCRRPALCRRRWPGSRSPGAGSGGGLKAGGERAEPVGGGPLRKRLREAASERNRLLAVGRWALAATSAPSQGGASGPSGPRWRCGPQAHAWSRNRPGIQGRWGRRLGRSAPIPALGVDGRRTRSCRSRSELSDEGPPEARPAIARGATAAAAGPAPCRARPWTRIACRPPSAAAIAQWQSSPAFARKAADSRSRWARFLVPCRPGLRTRGPGPAQQRLGLSPSQAQLALRVTSAVSGPKSASGLHMAAPFSNISGRRVRRGSLARGSGRSGSEQPRGRCCRRAVAAGASGCPGNCPARRPALMFLTSKTPNCF